MQIIQIGPKIATKLMKILIAGPKTAKKLKSKKFNGQIKLSI